MKCRFHLRPLSIRTRVRKRLCVPFKPAVSLLLILLLGFNTYAYTQYVSITKQNVSLESVFSDIKKQTGYTFFYKGKINPGELRLNVDLKHVSLENALTECLAQFKLNYTIVGKTIVITTANASVAPVTTEAAPTQVITGSVTDSISHDPMVAVTILVKN